MFLYLSFLRPPPTRVNPSAAQRTICITPQISNDLRTEYPETILDLYFAWIPVGFKTPDTPSLKKLTTYQGSSSRFKEVHVPFPLNASHGQEWTLVLTTSPRLEDVQIPLEILGDCTTLLPVLSMPIAISSKDFHAPSKQEKIRRIYTLCRRTISLTEQTSFDLDKKVWDSGLGLSSWLIEHFTKTSEPQTSGETLQSVLQSKRALSILELGAGIGVVSIVLGVLRTMVESCQDGVERHDTIHTTDLPSAIPLIKENIAKNNHLFSDNTNQTTAVPSPSVLDWNEPIPITIPTKLDVVIMADVTYNTASFPALIRTLSALQPKFFVLGYKERDVEERTLWDMAESVGIHFTQVAERVGAGPNVVEIWVGTRLESS
ncbi:putative methyltransferase-domain-containing protein [Flagelloscypha sp. PMI_526]|nr:putative methyltransferase-domain-containing protein [Flagelloscypha sp. PMI_526]